MKILYAIQGTGNGHLARALDIIPALKAYGNVDILVSGIQGDISLPFEIKYKFYGMSFIFGQKGDVNYYKTWKSLKFFRLLNDIFTLPVHQYDLVISDFEPISAWACKWRHKKCFGLSHQSAVLHPMAPKPKQNNLLGKSVLKHYAPTDLAIGFHFTSLEKNISTPIIRQQIRNIKIKNEGHYTVYLPAYNDHQLVKELSVFTGINWQVFSKHCKEAFTFKNINVLPVNNQDFIESFTSCAGIICGAGFETPAEAIFMGKKLLVIPMEGQYEQQCNAAFLATIGIEVVEKLNRKNRNTISQWIDADKIVQINYPKNTEQTIKKLMELYWTNEKEIMPLFN